MWGIGAYPYHILIIFIFCPFPSFLFFPNLIIPSHFHKIYLHIFYKPLLKLRKIHQILSLFSFLTLLELDWIILPVFPGFPTCWGQMIEPVIWVNFHSKALSFLSPLLSLSLSFLPLTIPPFSTVSSSFSLFTYRPLPYLSAFSGESWLINPVSCILKFNSFAIPGRKIFKIYLNLPISFPVFKKDQYINLFSLFLQKTLTIIGGFTFIYFLTTFKGETEVLGINMYNQDIQFRALSNHLYYSWTASGTVGFMVKVWHNWILMSLTEEDKCNTHALYSLSLL